MATRGLGRQPGPVLLACAACRGGAGAGLHRGSALPAMEGPGAAGHRLRRPQGHRLSRQHSSAALPQRPDVVGCRHASITRPAAESPAAHAACRRCLAAHSVAGQGAHHRHCRVCRAPCRALLLKPGPWFRGPLDRGWAGRTGGRTTAAAASAERRWARDRLRLRLTCCEACVQSSGMASRREACSAVLVS